jgi:NAD(P)-dependent dehydrogenase (short-subunit alcohol dehydrogenase family)
MSDKRTIVITGAGRGLGLAMTEGFIERGHTIIGCSRSAEHVKKLAKRFSPPHRFDTVNVADASQVRRWAESILADGGAPDLLVNNAAVVNKNAPLWKVPVEEFDRVIDVNIKGTYYVCKHFIPAMVAKKRGVIVNFSSGWGRSTSPEVAPYCASKYAIEGLTQALAAELPEGMAAVPLNPGIINTDMLQSCFGSNAASYPDPAEWAETSVPFLLKLGPKDNGRPLTVK